MTPESLVGKYVRFKHLPAGCEPKPMKVTVEWKGWIFLAGHKGYYSPELFVVVDPPKEAA